LVEHLERIAGRRQGVRQPLADLEQLTLHRRLVGHGCRAYGASTLAPMDHEPQLLSVVSPMYEEEDTVGPFTERMTAALGALPYELILVDDGSKDATAEEMAR